MSKRIAFVDDEEAMHPMIRATLSEANTSHPEKLFGSEGLALPASQPILLKYDMDHFLDPIKAREAIQEAFEEKRPYALLITDIRMPTRSGDWLVAQARKIDSAIRIIVLTSYSDATIEDLTRSAGDSNFLYLNKTAPPRVIKQAVEAELASWQEDFLDRRRWQRVKFDGEVRICSSDGTVVKGVNISAGGICLMDPSFALSVDTPLEIEIVGGRAKTKGMVRWVEPLSEGQCVGIQFVEEDETLLELISPTPEASSGEGPLDKLTDSME